MEAFDKPRESEDAHGVKCELCSRTVADMDAAAVEEWLPSFYDYNEQERGPVCPTCVEGRLKYDETTSTYEVIERSN